MLNAVSQARQGNYNPALESLASMMLGGLGRNAMWDYNAITDGVRSRTGNMLLTRPGTGPGAVTYPDLALRLAGFQSGRLAQAYEQERWEQEINLADSPMVQQWHRRLGRAQANGDSAETARVLQEVNDWNAANPTRTVTLSRSAITQAMRREQEGMLATSGPRRAAAERERLQRSLTPWQQ